MSAFHVSEDGVIRPCSAQTPEACTARKFSGERLEHFTDFDEASAYVERVYEKRIGAFNTLQHTPSISDRLDSMNEEELISFANAGRENFDDLREVIDGRVSKITEKSMKLSTMAPDRSSTNSVSEDVYSMMKRDLNTYKDRTAELLEAQLQSKFYRPKYLNRSLSAIGEAQRRDRDRYNTLSGEDIAVLAQNDFDSSGLLGRLQFRGLEKSKVLRPRSSNLTGYQSMRVGGRGGTLYRNAVWKEDLKDTYADEHRDIVLINSPGAYSNSEEDWQQGEFDAVMVDTTTQRAVGLLELKTNVNLNRWSDGVPVAAKAEALYNLETTGLEYVDLFVMADDSQTKIFRVEKGEKLPGGQSMAEYLKQRVQPWFEGIKKSR